MQIEHNSAMTKNEADVETRILVPLLTGEQYLAYRKSDVFSKGYLAPTVLDKSAGRTSGYYPDFSVWRLSLMIVAVEAKAPTVDVTVGYREASLYARHVNQSYRTGCNPCKFLISCNGLRLLAGYHDADPQIDTAVSQIRPGSKELTELITFCGPDALSRHSAACLAMIRVVRATVPYQMAGGPAILTARKPVNSLAIGLAPLLDKYFSSSDPADTPEIVEKAYVTTSEITEYDGVLESLLKERLVIRHASIVQEIEPNKKNEPLVTSAINHFLASRPPAGRLQIIQGNVGAGKSIFIRRYKEFLQPAEQKLRNRWAFIDYLAGPSSLKGSGAEQWLCSTFYDSFGRENTSLDLNSPEVHRGIYSRMLQRRKPIYDEIGRDAPEQAARLRANDFAQWQDDPEITTRGLADYVLGSRQDALIVVMDNVDKLSLDEQLNAFELSLWFMALTKAFVILQMRDETYERFRDRPPLDTYRTGVTFHITPPRFIDVVKRRLDLGIEFLVNNSDNAHHYELQNGLRIKLPKDALGAFLKQLYIELFGENRNVARLVKSLAGLNVRRALEIFSAIITSGHLSTNSITSVVRGAGGFPITDILIVKILMRTGYKLFSSNSGFISNIFFFDEAWQRPDNFLLIECLFFLAKMRRSPGQIELQGFFTCSYIADNLQLLGYTNDDVISALNYLLQRDLISPDHQGTRRIEADDTVRILPSGYMHLRLLPEQLEYCFGTIPTTPIVNVQVANELAIVVERENLRDDLTEFEQVLAVEKFYNYLVVQLGQRKPHSRPTWSKLTGAEYVIERVRDGLTRYWNFPIGLSGSATELDEI